MPTTPPTIDNPPTAPARTDRATFITRADAFIAWFATFVTQIIAAIANVYANAVEAFNSATAAASSAAAALASQGQAETHKNAAATSASTAAAALANVYAQPSTYATSTTSLTVGTGSKTLTTQSGKTITAAQIVVIESAVDPRAWMLGAVTSYSSTTLVVNVTATGGAGTFADWRISLLGALPISARQGQALTWDNGRPVWGRKVRRLGGTTNLLLRSSEFENAAWGISGATVTANAVVGPFGATDADKVENTGAALGYIAQTVAITGGALYTASFFAKAGTAASARFEAYPQLPAADLLFEFVPATGVIYKSPSYLAPIEQQVVEFGSVDCGGGWFRYYVTFIATSAQTTAFLVLWASLAATGGEYTYYFGAQINPGRLGAYVPTTGAAASGGGVLRPDLTGYSEQVDTAEGSTPFVIGGSATLTTRSGKSVSPLGTLRATEYLCTVTGYLACSLGSVLLDGVMFSIGVWVRKSDDSARGGHAIFLNNGNGAVLMDGNVTSAWSYQEVTFVWSTGDDPSVYLGLYTTGSVHFWGFRIAKGPTARYTLPNVTTVVAGASEMLTLNTQHAIDSAAAAITVAPPDGMKPGDWFEIADDGGSAAANNITLMRGPYPAIAGAAEDFVIDINNWSGRFTFDPSKGLVLA